jgi:hypothetical protein
MGTNLSRRLFLCQCAGSGLMLTGCGGGGSDTPDAAASPASTDVGCALYSTSYAAGQACNTTTTSSGSPYESQIRSEFSAQRTFFQLPAVNLLFINDCSPNAFADPRTKNILLGINLISSTLDAYKNQSNSFFTLLPLYAILAHEFGHQLQFANSWSNNSDGVVQEELEADMWAGFYVGLKGLSSGFQVKQTMEQFYNFGTNDFWNPNWHGTAFQRANAFTDGLLVADEFNKGKIGNTFSSVRQRLQELVAVELRYPIDDSLGFTSKSDIRHQCDQYKAAPTYQECGALLGFPYDSLPLP